VALATVRTDPEDDRGLVLAARRGDGDAFRVLYERYAPGLLGLLTHRLGDHGLAEDALQEAFVKAHRALDVFDESRPLGPWLVAIAENVATDARRRTARAPKPLPADAVEPLVPDEQGGVLTRREGEECVRAALAALPPDARAVLALRYQQGLTQRDTAAKLGCSTRTLQTREAQALAQIVRLLDARRAKAEKGGGP
jgi:RNA polymerase sigma factor (sigma-70 family)